MTDSCYASERRAQRLFLSCGLKSHTDACSWNVKADIGAEQRSKQIVLFIYDRVQNSDSVNRLTCDNNQSQEGNQCEGGTTEVIYAAVDFNNKTKTNRKQQSDSHSDEDVIYSTVCRFELMNPSYIEPLWHDRKHKVSWSISCADICFKSTRFLIFLFILSYKSVSFTAHVLQWK